MNIRRMTGRHLARLAEEWTGEGRRWYEHLPWVGDKLLRRRIIRTVEAVSEPVDTRDL